MSVISSAPPGTSREGSRARGPSWRGFLRGTGRVLLGIVIGVIIFVAFASLMRLQELRLPAVTGSSAVGRTEISLTDDGRADPFASDGRRRELAVWIWYPALPDASATQAPYLPDAWAPVAEDFPLSQDPTTIRTHSLADAPLDGTPPVVVLQPGHSQPVAKYTALAEDLASHGYAVVAINETGSALTVFPDGHAVPATPAGGPAGATVDAWYASAQRVTDVWVADAQFVVESLRDAPPAIGPLDLSRVAYIGHSLGGAAAFEACSQDDACAAAVDLDGTLWTEVRHAGLTAPRLLLQREISGACDEFCSRADADFDAVMADGDSARYTVAGATHANFGDLSLLFGITNGIDLGPIDGQRMTDLMRDTVRAFLDVHVLGDAPAAFSEAVGRYPELTPAN